MEAFSHHSLGTLMWHLSEHMCDDVRRLENFCYAVADLYDYDHQTFKNELKSTLRRPNTAMSESVVVLNDRKKRKAVMRLLCEADSKVTSSSDWARHSDILTDNVSAGVAIDANNDYIQYIQKNQREKYQLKKMEAFSFQKVESSSCLIWKL